MTAEWLRFARDVRPDDGDIRLLCFAHAGGGAASFVRWMDLFSPALTTVRVQLPGREDLATRPALQSIDDVVEGLLPQVTSLSSPIALYGHSMGALVAFELARVLRAEGMPAEHLFVSGRRAPQLPARGEPIHRLPDVEFAAALETNGGAVGFSRQSASVLRYAIPLTKADLTLCEEHIYRRQSKLECPITAFHGAEDIVVDRAEAEAWRDQTKSTFGIRIFSGDHFFHQTHRAEIAAHISEVLHAPADH